MKTTVTVSEDVKKRLHRVKRKRGFRSLNEVIEWLLEEVGE